MNKRQRRAIELAARILADARGHYIGEVGIEGWADWLDAPESAVSDGLDVVFGIISTLEAGNVEWTPDDRLTINDVAIDFEDAS